MFNIHHIYIIMKEDGLYDQGTHGPHRSPEKTVQINNHI